MSCPVHIWLPAMAALAPFARVARDRIHALGIPTFSSAVGRASRPDRTVKVVQRFAPVGAARPAGARPESESAG